MTNHDPIQHYWHRMALPFANVVSSLLPATRLFRLRSILFQIAGVDVDTNARLVGGARIHFSNTEIGSGCWINHGCQLYSSQTGRICIGRNVHIGPACLIGTGTHEIGNANQRAGKDYSKDIHIGDGVWIGMGVVITAGVRIGKGTVVAAGSVLIGEYPENVLIAGVPAIVKNHLNTIE